MLISYGDGDPRHPSYYENYEASLTDKTNWSVKTNGTKFALTNPAFKGRFHNISIRTDNIISVKLNSTSSDSISVAANTTFEITNMAVYDIFITNTGTAAVKIFMC